MEGKMQAKDVQVGSLIEEVGMLKQCLEECREMSHLLIKRVDFIGFTSAIDEFKNIENKETFTESPIKEEVTFRGEMERAMYSARKTNKQLQIAITSLDQLFNTGE